MFGEHRTPQEIKQQLLEYYAKQQSEQPKVAESATAREKTKPVVEGTSGGDEEITKRNAAMQELQPKGKGYFGNIYDQFKGRVKDAFDFLLQRKSGDLLGVFHDNELGDIDLVWGSKEEDAGLEHIIDKHVGEGKDFATIDEARQVIESVIEKGRKIKENADKVIYELDGKRVVVRKNLRNKKTGELIDTHKNWVVTSYDNNIPKSQKKSETSTLTTPESTTKAGLSPSTDLSNDKVTTNSANKQEESVKNAENTLSSEKKELNLPKENVASGTAVPIFANKSAEE